MIKLLNIDCLEYMKDVPDKYFDLLYSDPQYGINESAHRNISRTKLAKTKNYKKEVWDQAPPTKEYFKEAFRISKHQIIWDVNYFTTIWNFTPGRIVWHKDNGDNNFSDCEIAFQSYRKGIRYYRYKWQGMLQENMKDKQIRIHPTEKPIPLSKWILRSYAEPEFKIIDTHGGSMSSVIAGIDFDIAEMVCCEIDKDYFEAGKKRVLNHVAQLNMYIKKPEIIFK